MNSSASLPIRRALLSVSDKSGIVDLARALADNGVELISTGGTAAKLRETLEGQRAHVAAELARHEAEYQQLTLSFLQEEARQLDADMRHWRRRLDLFDRNLADEPERIRAFYEVRAERIEPVGIVYLWPETN